MRAFNAVGGEPVFIRRATGSRLYGEDGQEYLDYMMSWGPLILGHAHPRVVEAVRRAAGDGLSYGACHAGEARLAEQIQQAMPHLERLRLVSSGTEAAMSALRLARAATGRDKIIKFRGCYHGHADAFLIQAGSGALTHSCPSSPGVPAGAAADTLLADYNDLASVEAICTANPGAIAAIFVEPVAGNMGLVLPAKGFLTGLRALCDKHGALLVFDEVITGFRVNFGGAAALYHTVPDLTVLGKIIGGGMPLAAYGGRADLMRLISPEGSVYQAGTLSGNPVSCAAGTATLEILREENPYPQLEKQTTRLTEGIRQNLCEAGLDWAVNHCGSLFTIFCAVAPVNDYAAATSADTALYAKYFRAMLAEGIYLPPAQFEACFLSAAHTDADLDHTLETQRKVLKNLF